jgi:hypothetical protein
MARAHDSDSRKSAMRIATYDEAWSRLRHPDVDHKPQGADECHRAHQSLYFHRRKLPAVRRMTEILFDKGGTNADRGTRDRPRLFHP